MIYGIEESPTSPPISSSPTTSIPTTSSPTTSSPTTSNPTTSSPTTKPACTDDINWKFNGKYKYNCSWVRQKPGKRCKKTDENEVRADVACPIPCKSTKCT